MLDVGFSRAAEIDDAAARNGYDIAGASGLHNLGAEAFIAIAGRLGLGLAHRLLDHQGVEAG